MADPKSPFRPSFLKIERAQRHIQELEQVITDWLATDPVTVRTTGRPHQEMPPPPHAPEELKGQRWFQMAFEIEMRSHPVPEVTSAILGDILHNLRSSLDLMACALAREVSGTDNEVSFPFAISPDDMDKMIARRNFDKAGEAAVKLLKETIKPYKGGNDLLRAIHDLNVQDKHRTLILQRIGIGGPLIDLAAKGGESIFASDPNKPTAVDLLFPNDCALAEKKLVATLHDLVEVTTSVVKAFEALGAPAG